MQPRNTQAERRFNNPLHASPTPTFLTSPKHRHSLESIAQPYCNRLYDYSPERVVTDYSPSGKTSNVAAAPSRKLRTQI